MVGRWSNRKLTLSGRVTVIESLLSSKVTHLFLALPNPLGNLLKSIEKMFYKHLWHQGPDRIERIQLVKNLEI